MDKKTKKWSKHFKSISYIARYIWECDKKYVFIQGSKAVLSGIYPLINITFPKIIIDMITARQDFASVFSIILIFSLIQFIYYLLQLGLQYYNSINSAYLIKKINNDILKKMAEVDLSFFEDPESYDNYQKARNEAGSRAKSTFDTMLNMVSTIISLCGMTYVLVLFDWFVLLMLFAVVCLIFIITNKGKKLSFQFANENVPLNRQTNYLYYLLTSRGYSKEIRIFSIGDWLIQKFNLNTEKLIDKNKNFQKKMIRLNSLSNILSGVQNLFLFSVLVYKTLEAQISIGNFTMYFMAAQNFTQGLMSLTGHISNIFESTLFIENLIHFLELKPQIQNGPFKIAESNYKQTEKIIEIKNISFQYPAQQKYVFRNFNLDIYQNEKLLIVGENGAGKTTLIKLILRLYEPQEGEISFLKNAISEYNLEEYRKQFSVVFQDYNKYAFTIAENITFRDENEEEKKEILKSISASGLTDKIKELNMGIYTPLTRQFDQNGTDFSAGEMQKLALARAYMRSSPILIFDEPTSALDPLAEREMYSNFMKLCNEKTAIFISHRLSCATYMDRIVMIKNGTIAEIGSHTELMNKKGAYYDMFIKQGENYISHTRKKEDSI